MTLSPHAAKLVGKQTVQFYVADGKYRMQVFALEDLQDGNITVYCPDVLTEAVEAGLLVRPGHAATSLYGIVGSGDALSSQRARSRFGEPRRPLQGHGGVEPDGGADHTTPVGIAAAGHRGGAGVRESPRCIRTPPAPTTPGDTGQGTPAKTGRPPAHRRRRPSSSEA